MGTATYGTVRRLDMTAIADAIRAKGGASGSLAPSEMASAIANIPAGGTGGDGVAILDGSISQITSPVSSIGGSAFRGCTALSLVYFPVCSRISGNAFDGCTSLVSLFFRASDMSSIASTVFSNTNSTFRVCVPTSLVTYYQTLPGWSSIASQIEAFDDWED